MIKVLDCCKVRGPGRIRGAIMLALIFLLRFLHQGKKWKINKKNHIEEIDAARIAILLLTSGS